jgi:hypothetical protein
LVEIAITKLKRYKSPVELIQAGGEALQFQILKLINSIWSKEELPHQWKESIIITICKKGDKLIVVIMKEYHYYQLHTASYLIFFSQG